jgi:hypothetical protein
MSGVQSAILFTGTSAVSLANPLEGLSDVTGSFSFSRKMVSTYSANSGNFYLNTGGNVETIYDQSGNSRNWTQSNSGLRNAAPTTGGPNSILGMNCTGGFYEGSAISSYIASTTKYVIFSFTVHACTANGVATYGNQGVWGDKGANTCGLYVKTGPTVASFIWDGSDRHSPFASISLDTAYVVEFRHEGSLIYERVNKGSWSVGSVAGNTATSDLCQIGRGWSSTGLAHQGYIWEGVFFNVVPSTGTQDALATNMMSWVGAV